jgi:AcrR family transcriptional regulator
MPDAAQDLSPRDKLINTAIALFSEQGFNGTGINLILKRSGVAKKTLYHHFASKDELIVAALEAYAERAYAGVTEAVEVAAAFPRDRIEAFFTLAQDWFERPTFHGCLFIGAVGEFTAQNSPVRDVCKRYKARILAYLQDLCFQAALPDPLWLGQELFMLYEGATVMAQVSGAGQVGLVARDAALALLAAADAES